MKINELFKVFDFEMGNIIIERMEYCPWRDNPIIEIEEDVIRCIRDGGAWLSEWGNHDILSMSVVDYDSRKSANGVTTLRVIVAF